MAGRPDQAEARQGNGARLESEFVGVDFNFSQYIQDNIEEAVSGVKGENSVKIFGRDLAELERLSKAVQNELAKVPGVADAGAFNLLGQPNLVIQVDRAKAARYGITVSDMNTVVQAAIGGQEVTRVYEGEMNFPLTVRLAAQYRDNIDAIRSVPVALPNSDPKSPTAYIALGDRRRSAAGNRRGLYLSRRTPSVSFRSNTACAAAIWGRPWPTRRRASPRMSS